MRAHLTTEELAERFRTSENTVRYWQHIGYGPKGIKVGRRRLYPLDEVEHFEAELQAVEANSVA